MIRAYAIADRSFVVPVVKGIGGQRLSSVCERNLALIVEDDVKPSDSTADAALAFGQVVERLVQEGNLLPVRFGTTFTSRSLAAEELRSHCEDWRSILDRVAGCLELAVRAHVVEPEVPQEPLASGTTTGRDYVMARLAGVRREEALASRVVEALGASCRAVRRMSAHGRRGVELSVLVNREDAHAARQRLTAWAERQQDMTLTCSGPWAPYSFADLDAFQEHQGVLS